MPIPALVGLGFEVVRALAAGDAAALGRLATPELAAALGDPRRSREWLAEESPWRQAAIGWAKKSSVKARTDDAVGLVRFHEALGEAWLIEFAIGAAGVRLRGFRTMPDAVFEQFGRVV